MLRQILGQMLTEKQLLTEKVPARCEGIWQCWGPLELRFFQHLTMTPELQEESINRRRQAWTGTEEDRLLQFSPHLDKSHV